MAKRFVDTKMWSDDWFTQMPMAYKMLWHYILSACDHAGVFKVNLRSFCLLNEVKLTSNEAIDHFNLGKQRIRIISDSTWYIEDFVVFQYGPVLNLNNRVHLSVVKELEKVGVKLTSIRGLVEVKEGVKDKDKDKEKNKEKKEELNIEFNINTGEGKILDPEKAEILHVPVMLKKWKEQNSGYPEDEAKDFPALSEISQFIRKQEKIRDDPALNETASNTIVTIWEAIAKHVASHSFFRNYSLQQVSKHIQNITQDFKNGNGNTKGGQQSGGRGTAKSFYAKLTNTGSG